MPHDVLASRPRSATRRFGRALVEAGVVLSLTLAILAVILAGVDRAAAATIDVAGLDAGRATIGAVLLALFAGLCVLTTFMLRNTVTTGASPVKTLARRVGQGRGTRLG